MPEAASDAIPGVTHLTTKVSPAEGTTTADGALDGTTVVDTTRTEPNNHWNNMALLITSGAQSGQVREITNWVLATGTFTVNPAFGGQILAGVTYEVLTQLPADIDVAAIEAKLDDPATGLATIKAEVTAIEGKLDAPAGGLGDIKAEVTAVEGKLDARLDATVSSRAPESGGNIAAIKAKTDLIPADIATQLDTNVPAIKAKTDLIPADITTQLNTNVPAIKAKTDLIPADITTQLDTNIPAIKTQTDKIPRILCSMDFWSDVDDVINLTAASSDDALPDVVVAGLPTGVTLVRVVAMFMCRAIENTSASGANGINGAGQKIRVKKSTGTWGVDDVAAIDLADNMWLTAASTREMGDVIIGDNDVKSEVDENATYNLRFEDNSVDYDNLRLNDVKVGIRVYFTI
jgi:hypothetical protein